MTPYYESGGITLYNCDFRDIEPEPVDLVLMDPPYGETSLAWDRRITNLPAFGVALAVANRVLVVFRLHADVLGNRRRVLGLQLRAGCRLGKTQWIRFCGRSLQTRSRDRDPLVSQIDALAGCLQEADLHARCGCARGKEK